MSWNFEHTYSELPEIFFREQKPEVAPAPKMVIFNEELAADLGLNSDELKNSPEIFAGTVLPHGAKPLSQAYAGYQFGHFAMLGDGRAVLLGEHITPDGRRFDIQLKGSGRTPFSRNGDGYASLLPMLREYIISEAMHALGIPTTRSLAVVLTRTDVFREKILQGAVLTRVASSHIRVGTFDYASAFGTRTDLQALADYSIWRHFPEIQDTENKYSLFLKKVAERQAALVAKWQLVGFVHGVMNTDNMSICGETIDYGPCAFMDTYDPDTVFSSIDTEGRYAYKNQPKIGAWNLSRLAEALLPIASTGDAIKHYHECYKKNWLNGMRAKMETPIEETLSKMEQDKSDYTNSFSHLKQNPKVIPRNHKVEEALAAAGQGDFSVMHKLLAALKNPYIHSEEYSHPPTATCCNYKTFCGT
ncbi:MAG: YdiU family protein [Defluviitaleaceae bacterium]|nr:YdiU family protein [Defluviitaleaceae bacterium]